MNLHKTNLWINFIELKYRLFYFLYSFLLTLLVCFTYRIEIFFLISNFFLEYENGFIYTSLLDPLIIYIKLSLLVTTILVFPVFIYLFGFFFFRSFYSYKLIYSIFYLFSLYFFSFVLFILTSNVILPILFEFLINFQLLNTFDLFELKLQATITQYYNFYFAYIFIYLFIILIPNTFLFLVFVGFLKKDFFLKYIFRKYLYLIVFFLFLIVSPPDFFLQIIILPFLILFLELYIYLITFFFSLYIQFE